MRIETEKAIEIIKSAGLITMKYFGEIKDHHISIKDDGSILTIADMEVDRFIRSSLEEAFPDHSVLSEESPNTRETENVWIIDPIDATKNFANGNPHFGISIALVKNGIPEIGVVFAPAKNELYVGERGIGATKNGIPIRPSATTNLSKSKILLAGSGDPATHAVHIPILAILKDLGAATAGRGCACLDTCAIASGEFDAFIHHRLSAWDVAGGIAILEATGGKAHLLNGNEKDLFINGIVATNSELCEQILEITKKYV